MNALRSLAEGRGGFRWPSEAGSAAFAWWAEYLAKARPREIRLVFGSPPVLLYTDGAVEEGGASVGALILDRVRGVVKAFGARVPAEVRQPWGHGGAGHV